jgi:formate--tetrahydrofolate ligase
MTTPTFSPRSIVDVAQDLGLEESQLEPYGRRKAKVSLDALEGPTTGKGRLILVSAINPTPAGEGKTTTSIGLAMGLRRLGKRVVVCLREPSLGPVFGVKGGGTGGGKTTLVPDDDINLHFTGDIHAITTAHNLLSAMVDNACHFGTPAGDKGPFDPRAITWGRVLDMNDRALRSVVVGLGRRADGVPRQDRFDITAASEVMAVVALAEGRADLEARLGRIVVGSSTSGKPVTAADLGAHRAMAALLRDAMLPNLVQTAEGGAALVHAGPFANIAHGCSSVVATRLGLRVSDYVVTEGGFGFDLGGEKFLDIKCRTLGAFPRAVVLVATLRALRSHGGVKPDVVDRAALERGLSHLDKHLGGIAGFGLPAIVAINVFPTDTDEELTLVEDFVRTRGARVARCEGYARGGEGALTLAETVADVVDASDAAPPAARFTYELDEPLAEKARKVAKALYGAKDVVFTPAAEKALERFKEQGYGGLPVCVAKTPLSLSDDPTLVGRPEGFTVTVREARLSAGAGFVVLLTGEIMTMPGLPQKPSALRIYLGDDGRVRGLMQND